MSDWPLTMDLQTARRYLTYTRQQFNALRAAGLIPPPRELLPGVARWHRKELDAAAARIWNLEADITDEQAKADARRALDAFTPAEIRRGDEGQRRPDLSVLPSRRPKDPPAAA
jgi:hypothetical protein